MKSRSTLPIAATECSTPSWQRRAQGHQTRTLMMCRDVPCCNSCTYVLACRPQPSRKDYALSYGKDSFAAYKSNGHNWITLATGEYYPDVLDEAMELYTPVLVLFGQLLRKSESSSSLLINIADVDDSWMRVQLARIFRKYVSPSTPVEMLRRRTKAREICEQFGRRFRPVQEVQQAYASRPIPDEALSGILWEYKDRGKKGYDLTAKFFDMFRSEHPELDIEGPEGAGPDIRLGTVFEDYSNPKRPVDFVIRDQQQGVLSVGLARYDSDRGGAQEDDRTGGYRNCADEILSYSKSRGISVKLIFVNDGPGLLLGSMWDDYVSLEESWPGQILVLTLRMVPERLTKRWLGTQPVKEING